MNSFDSLSLTLAEASRLRSMGKPELERDHLLAAWKEGLKSPDVLYQVAESFFMDHEYENTLKFITLACKYNSESPLYSYLLGMTFLKLKKPNEAVKAFLSISDEQRLFQADIELANMFKGSLKDNFGLSYLELVFRKSSTLDSLTKLIIQQIKVLHKLAEVPDGFLNSIQENLKLWQRESGDISEVYKWFGLFYQRVGLYEQSQEAYLRYLESNPDDQTVAHNLYQNFLSLGHYDKCFDSPIKRDQQQKAIGSNRDVMLARGIREISYSDLSRLVGKKVILSPEQGMGDQIWSLSFISVFQNEFGCDFEIWCAPKLADVLKGFLINRCLVKSFDQVLPQDGIDAYGFISMPDVMFLLHRWGLNLEPSKAFMSCSQVLENIIVRTLNSSDVPSIRSNLNRRVGLSWKSQGSSRGDTKNLSLSFLQRFREINNTEFICCQYGDVRDDLAHLKEHGLDVFQDETLNLYDSLVDSYRTIADCDKIITSSNVTAHIAGSLGVKTLLIVNTPTIWYWSNSSKSSWYQSVKVIRKRLEDPWDVLWPEVCNFLSTS